MGIPEWMLSIDSRKTKTLHGGACIQMYVHFKGGQAHRLEKDFSILISNGRLSNPSIDIPGYVDQKRKHTLSYRTCGVRDPNEKSNASLPKVSICNHYYYFISDKQFRTQFNGAAQLTHSLLWVNIFSVLIINSL